LNEDGDVEHSCVTSGGGIVGPDEKTLRQFEAEQAKKQKRREEKQHLAQEATIAHIDQHIDMMRFLQHPKAHL
jgi:phosphoenolpyruvate-protein kinase (PTS system EI component)